MNDAFYELFVYENLEHIIHKYRLKEQEELQKMEEEKNGAIDWAAEEEKMQKKADEVEA